MAVAFHDRVFTPANVSGSRGPHTLPSLAVTAGRHVLVMMTWRQSAWTDFPRPTASDTLGNTWTELYDSSWNFASERILAFMCKVSASGTTDISVMFQAAHDITEMQTVRVCAVEISGLDADAISSASFLYQRGDWIGTGGVRTIGPYSLTAGGEFLALAVDNERDNGATFSGWSSPYTALDGLSARFGTAYAIVNGPTTLSPTVTSSAREESARFTLALRTDGPIKYTKKPPTISGTPTSWTNPARVLVDDTNAATVAPAQNVLATGWWGGFFAAGAIPAGSTINKVELYVRHSQSSTVTTATMTAALERAGVVGSDTAALTRSNNAATATTLDMTSARPGGGTWQPADFDGTFRVHLRGIRTTGTACTFSARYITVAVTYTVPEGGDPVVVEFTGSGSSGSRGLATLDLLANLNGAGSSGSRGEAILQVVTDLLGAGSQGSRGLATLEDIALLAGAGSSGSRGDATFHVVVALSGAGSSGSRGEASLDSIVELAGSGSHGSAGDADLDVIVPMTGASSSGSAGAATVDAVVLISASSSSGSRGSATLVVDDPEADVTYLSGQGSQGSRGHAEMELLVDLVATSASGSRGNALVEDIALLEGRGAQGSRGTATVEVISPLVGSGSSGSRGDAAFAVVVDVEARGSSGSRGMAYPRVIGGVTVEVGGYRFASDLTGVALVQEGEYGLAIEAEGYGAALVDNTHSVTIVDDASGVAFK